ncbi:hypothetical protein H1D32_11835 [Anaerobacillus sp. CMMVII]|uniref:hypothetical protein n=1 Tax=Anaerobacillus sp. CMMVII TaxID=2755588 RepID=UPI0021B791BE|nr:hypothetical protein [Anaerobacillus sp. CMMVII]MCT8138381.1 hypothetical protein [Anaerobacillus sp. CMMVII]
MKQFAIIAFILIIGTIIISSFFFIGSDAVKDSTKVFIHEIVNNKGSQELTSSENEQIKQFFDSIQALGLPHPLIDGVQIHYYDVFTPPTENDEYLQYISVKYDPITGGGFDTDINFEYILYNEADGNPEEIYFGKIVVRSFDPDFSNKELLLVTPMEKQK